jgi:hypothetical protein
MADPGTLKRIDEPPGEETKGSRERSRPATGRLTPMLTRNEPIRSSPAPPERAPRRPFSRR